MSKLLLKPGCAFEVIDLGGFVILDALRDIARFFPQPITITAGTNGIHAATSKHYTGNAYDVRSKDMTVQERGQFRDSVEMALGLEKFTLLLEDEGRPSEHWHLQVRKGVAYTMKDFLA